MYRNGLKSLESGKDHGKKGGKRRMSKQVGFSYGILCDDLEVQAREQGYTLGKAQEKFELIKKSIHVLGFNDILTDSQKDKAFQKLNKQVIKALRPIKEEK